MEQQLRDALAFIAGSKYPTYDYIDVEEQDNGDLVIKGVDVEPAEVYGERGAPKATTTVLGELRWRTE